VSAPAGTIPTSEPYVFIEERRPGYTRYIANEGRRWEVIGECVQLGYCMVGAQVDGVTLVDLDTAMSFLDGHSFELDVPVLPGFDGCCPFTFVELPPGEPFDPFS
jgi:hypothetical protein